MGALVRLRRRRDKADIIVPPFEARGRRHGRRMFSLVWWGEEEEEGGEGWRGEAERGAYFSGLLQLYNNL